MAMLTLFTLGRTDEVLALADESLVLYPDAPLVHLMKAITFAIREDLPAARGTLERIRRQLTPADVQVLEAALPVLAAVSPMGRGEKQPRDVLLPLLLTLGPRALLDLAGRTPAVNGFAGLRVPPALEPGLRCLLMLPQRKLAEHLGGRPANADAKLLDDAQLAALGEAVGGHPEGTLCLIYAQERDDRTPFPALPASTAAWSEYRDRCAELGGLYERAYRCRGFLFDFRPSCLDLAAGYLFLAGQAKYGCPARPELIRRAADLVRRRMDQPVPPWPKLNAVHLRTFCAAAVADGDIPLARHVLSKFPKPDPKDAGLMRTVAHVEYASRAYLPALEAARACLASNPQEPDTVREMREVERKCLVELGKVPGQPPLPK